jgi:predicted P-loop ATPase
MVETNPAGAPWGATDADWRHFADRLGLQADLLPVVSNPTAEISPMSKMRDLGKTPSRYGPDDRVVGIPKWTQAQTTARDVQRWSAHSDLGICLQTRVVRAIDIDIADLARASEVAETIAFMAELPMRHRANSGKCLLAFRMPGAFAKRVIKTAHGIIEFLATGQQFVAVGTHPSGARYDWYGGLPAEIPELTPAEFEVLWQALVEQFALPGGATEIRAGMAPLSARSMDDVDDPTVTWLADNGWVTGYERDGRVDVRCPWEHGHSTDSGPTSTSWFPAGVGGFESGHFHCLHASCSARSDSDFLAATGHTRSAFDVVTTLATAKDGARPVEIEPLPVFQRDRAGAIEAILNNVLTAVRRPDVIRRRIGVDRFLCAMMTSDEDGSREGGQPGTWRRFSDDDYTRVRSVLEHIGFKPLKPEMVKAAVKLVAKEHAFDSAIDWLDSLEWDGVERIDTFFPTFFGVEDTPYTRAVGAYAWSTLAGRCLVPGVKADMAPVLIGLQAAGKTTAVEALAPFDDADESAFVEINLTKKDEDIARSLRGKLVGEIAELRGLQSRDAESIKAWVSRRTEEWTPKYEEFGTRFARRLLLVGTGNKDGFLDDETGERRWLPMRVGAVDVAGIRREREQLWAEGAHRFKRSGIAWQAAYQLAQGEHAKFKLTDVWDDAVGDWLARDGMDGEGGVPRGAGIVRVSEILHSALRIESGRQTRNDEMRVAKILTRFGYEKPASPVYDPRAKKSVRGWVKRADLCEFA